MGGAFAALGDRSSLALAASVACGSISAGAIGAFLVLTFSEHNRVAVPDAPVVRDELFDPDSNICLLTIMTQDRVASLHRMLAAWDGWVSIAMLVDDYETAVIKGMDLLRHRGQPVPAPRRVSLSVVEECGYVLITASSNT